MNESIFKKTRTSYSKLDKSKNYDILIVGGGLTGISLAYYLKDTGKNIILIEQGECLNSTTRFSTAKLTSLQQDVLTKIKKARGKKYAYLYYKAQKDAINRITSTIKKLNIPCHLEKSPSYLFVTDNKNIKKLKNEVALYQEFGEKINYCNKLPLSMDEKLCAKSDDNYVFNPIEYGEALLKELEKSKNVYIYEHTKMISISNTNNKYLVNISKNIQIMADKIVFAGHFPPFIMPYFFPLRVSIEKDFVLAKKHNNLKFNAINLDNNLISIRFYEDYMIKVIKSTKLNKKSIIENPYQEDVIYKWINYDIITRDSLPIIGKIKDNLYIATGYNTWGMTNSNFAAYLLKDILMEQENIYKKIVNPNRRITIKTLIKGISENITMSINFLLSYLPLVSKPKIIIENNKRIGVVKDKYNIEHKVIIMCPHMKCGLKYNKMLNTWDCPCHGSRYDIDGNLIRGPATKCIKK